MADSLNAKHQVEEDTSGKKITMVITLAVTFVMLLIISLSVSILTRGKSIEVQLFGTILCIILIAAALIIGVFLLIYVPRKLRKFNEELGETVKVLKLEIMNCYFDEAEKKLITAKGFGDKSYDVEILERTAYGKKEASELYLAYINVDKKNRVDVYVSMEPVSREDAVKIFNTENKDMMINLYTPNREAAYELVKEISADEEVIEHTDLKESSLKIKHFHHFQYEADEKYPVQIFYGFSD